MQLQVMLQTALAAHALHRVALGDPVVDRASLGIPDTLAIFVVALVVFGPKRLPEIGKQIGKLVFEFRRASNDFKLQIEEELRLSEQQDRQKVLDMQAAAHPPATPIAITAESTVSAVSSGTSDAGPEPPDRSLTANSLSASSPAANALTVQPPQTGEPVSALPPNHAAKNLMTPIPPASASPAEEPGPAAPDAIADTTAQHG